MNQDEEDEIDVMGEYSLDNILSKNDTLSVGMFEAQNSEYLNDYSVPSNWNELGLGDLDSGHSTASQAESPDQSAGMDENGWTEREKNLLLRGIEIFGKNSPIKLAQFIGTKIVSEVRFYLDKVCFASSAQSRQPQNSHISTMNDNNVLVMNDEIPTAAEEIVVSNNNSENIFKSDKKKVVRNKPQVKFKTELNVPASGFINKKIKKRKIQKSKVGISQKEQIHIFTGDGLSVPLSTGEQVIRIRNKPDSDVDSDIEIDIEDEATATSTSPATLPSSISSSSNQGTSTSIKKKSVITVSPKDCTKTELDMSLLSQETSDKLNCPDVPALEAILDQNVVTEMEKFIFDDFFSGKTVNTASRYYTIRNYILKVWQDQRPHYITKTCVRSGLRNCGDVNNISNIHSYLEQIGAINFQTSTPVTYIRPLLNWLKTIYSKTTIKESKVESKTFDHNIKNDVRSRLKKFVADGEGGCTLMHNESGVVVQTTVVHKEASAQKAPRAPMRKAVPLIYCRSFPDARKPNYGVEIDLAALLLMDLHAHMSQTEVMGLIGGAWDSARKVVRITRYVACKNIAHHLTHCEMCPISQATATETLHEENLRVFGWFHSHPTFAPEPSHTDVDTQLAVQKWLGGRRYGDVPACVGIIMTPFGGQGALIASPYRCMIVEENGAAASDGLSHVPYKFPVRIRADEIDVDEMLHHAWQIMVRKSQIPSEKRIQFGSPYFLDRSLTHIDKFITSVKMNLAKCVLEKSSCDIIIDGLTDICLNRTSTKT